MKKNGKRTGRSFPEPGHRRPGSKSGKWRVAPAPKQCFGVMNNRQGPAVHHRNLVSTIPMRVKMSSRADSSTTAKAAQYANPAALPNGWTMLKPRINNSVGIHREFPGSFRNLALRSAPCRMRPRFFCPDAAAGNSVRRKRAVRGWPCPLPWLRGTKGNGTW